MERAAVTGRLEAAGYLLTFQVCCSLVTAPFMSPTVIAKNEFRLQKSLQLYVWREGVPGRREMCVEGRVVCMRYLGEQLVPHVVLTMADLLFCDLDKPFE